MVAFFKSSFTSNAQADFDAIENRSTKVMHPMRMINRICILVITASLGAGCVGYQFKSKVPEQFEDFRSQITPGQTSREEAHQGLGKPFISDEHVEVYRVLSGQDLTINGFLIPVVWTRREYIIYAMMVYSQNGVVESIDWDIFKDGPAQVFGYVDAIDWRSASLQAGGYRFESFELPRQRRNEILLAPPSVGQVALPPPSGMCALYLILPDSEFDFYLNGEFLVHTPIITVNLLIPAFVKVLIPGGDNEFRAEPRGFHRTISCQPGGVMYVYPRIETLQGSAKGLFGGTKNEYRGEIIVSDTPEESLEGRQRVLFYNGRWIGDDYRELLPSE
jgi:hypothetical protein